MISFFYTILILAIAALFTAITYYFKPKKLNHLGFEDRIEGLLPQTQCGQCQYPGCAPYAKAIANGENAINLCTPGGQATVDAIAQLLHQPSQKSATLKPPKKIAIIHEEECIGCTKCIKACPVDAILGASKQMHTIIAQECTGCELCIAPCPVDCIGLIEVPEHLEQNKKSPHPTSPPCINCGLCNSHCPEGLLPQQLYRSSLNQDYPELEKQQLLACTNCQACDAICPSELTLSATFEKNQQQLKANRQAKNKANLAKRRFTARENRLEQQRQLKAAADKKKRAVLAKLKQQSQNKKTTVNTAKKAGQEHIQIQQIEQQIKKLQQANPKLDAQAMQQIQTLTQQKQALHKQQAPKPLAKDLKKLKFELIMKKSALAKAQRNQSSNLNTLEDEVKKIEKALEKIVYSTCQESNKS